MFVRQLVGRLAGQIIDMPFTVAQSCIASGTAVLPDAPVNVKGLEIPQPVPVAEVPKPVVAGGYTVRMKGPAWADVIGPDGKAVNDKALRKADAEALVEERNGDGS